MREINNLKDIEKRPIYQEADEFPWGTPSFLKLKSKERNCY